MKRFIIFFLSLFSFLSQPVVAQEEPMLTGPVPQGAIDAAIGRGVDFLIKDQDLDGSWRSHADVHRAGVTGLAIYTLLKGGLSNNHQSVRRGLGFLDVCEAKTTYEAACMILAYSEADPVHYRSRLQQLADLLVGWCDGEWAYPHGPKDLSNTHYGTMGLRYAHRLGLKVPEKTWKRIGKAIIRQQLDDGGFPYRPGGKPTLSMSAAGVGVACMVREAMRDFGPSSRELSRDMDKVIERGLVWFDENYNLHEVPWPGNVGGETWSYYFLYALQRVGLLAPAQTIAGHDWYQDGARYLMKKQEDKGSWGVPYGDPQANTCLAILFLRRASGPSTGSDDRSKQVFRTKDPESDMSVVVAGEQPTRVWIESFHQLILDSYEWPEEEGQGLRIHSVQYWNGEDLLAEVPGDPSKPAGIERFPTKLTWDGPGEREITAVVRIKLPQGEEEDELELRSTPLSIVVSVGMLPWMRDAIDDHPKNLLRNTKVRCSASSSLSAHWDKNRVVDGLMGRGWVCKGDDSAPEITLELNKAQRGNVLLFTHARERGSDPDAFARAKFIEIQINKMKPFRVELGPDEGRKTRVVLNRMQKIRRIRLRLIDLIPGKQHKSAGGLMEVELQSVKGAR